MTASDLAGLVAVHDAAAAGPDPAVLALDPGLERELVGARQRAAPRRPSAARSSSWTLSSTCGVGRGEEVGTDAVQQPQPVGAGDLVAVDVPLPGADPGDPLALGQLPPALGELVEDPAPGAVVADPVQERDERRRRARAAGSR